MLETKDQSETQIKAPPSLMDSSKTNNDGSSDNNAKIVSNNNNGDDKLVFEYFDLINGELRKPTVARGIWMTDPNTGDNIIEQMSSDDQAIEDALRAAREAHEEGTWTSLTINKRASFFEKIAVELEKMEKVMSEIDSMNTGVVIGMTSCIIPSLKMIFNDFAGKIRSGFTAKKTTYPGAHGDIDAVRKPWGPTLILAPWNVPGGTVAPKICAALAAGAPVILKPSEWAPFSLILLAKVFHTVGFPPGVFQLLNGAGDVGAKLVYDPRIKCVNFTGSVASGRKVAIECASSLKPVMLELGGSNPMIILEDADLEHAVEGVIQGLTLLNGQWCCGLGRLLVNEQVWGSLASKIMMRLSEMKLGGSLELSSEMGPLSSKLHYNLITQRITEAVEKGGKLHRSTQLPTNYPNGNFVPPTLISNLPPDDVTEEIFGPVAFVHLFNKEEEAVRIANMAPGMLMATIFTKDKSRGMRLGAHVEAGMVMVNGVGFGFDLAEGATDEPTMSFWGTSGLGEDGPADKLLSFFTGNRVVGINGKIEPRSSMIISSGIRVQVKNNFRKKYYSRLGVGVGMKYKK